MTKAKKQPTPKPQLKDRIVKMIPPAKRGIANYLRQLPLPVLFGLILVPAATTNVGYEMIYPSQLWAVAVFYVGTACLLSLVYYVFLKGERAARLLATVLATYVLLTDFDQRVEFAMPVLRTIFPVASRNDGFQSFVFLILVLVLIGLLAKFVTKLAAKKLTLYTQYQTLTVVLVAMAAVSVLQVVPTYLRWNQMAGIRPQTPMPTASEEVSEGAKPDIYYIVFDRYASDQSLRDNFDFDNSDMSDFLRKRGFIVKDEAFSNYQTTAPSLASTLRMDYHSDLSDEYSDADGRTSLPYRRILEDTTVSQFLREQGYETIRLGSWWGVTREESGSRNINPHYEMQLLGRRGIISEFHGLVLKRSYLGNLLTHGIGVGSVRVATLPTDDYRDIFSDQMRDIKQLATEKQEQPRFILGHVLIPHPPYIFDKDGSRVVSYEPGDNDIDVPRSLKYTNQLTYLNNQLKELVADIQDNSKNPPIIILQADEGPYPLVEKVAGWEPPHLWQEAPDETLKLKYGIQAAYYLPGIDKPERQVERSSVNLFRSVFNTYLGTELPYLPDCSFVVNQTEPFKFMDITARLYGTEEDPACQAVHSN